MSCLTLPYNVLHPTSVLTVLVTLAHKKTPSRRMMYTWYSVTEPLPNKWYLSEVIVQEVDPEWSSIDVHERVMEGRLVLQLLLVMVWPGCLLVGYTAKNDLLF